MLFEEIDGLEARGVDTSALVVSGSAHVIAPYNRTLDKVTERFLGNSKIGTTGRGIGPTYADKMARIGIRVQDLFDADVLRAKVDRRAEPEEPGAGQDLQPQGLRRRRGRRRARVLRRPAAPDGRRHRRCCSSRCSTTGETVVLEAGQATLLDVDHGTYPFVTSSNATAGGACTGSGIPPTRISRVIAVIKAYTTRVGEGPFPTELLDDKGELLRNNGAEFGTTTGRPRRCGWFDAVIGRYATRINGVTDFVLTKLDVLTGLDEVPVCVAYDVDGVRHDELPMNQAEFARAVPIYETFPGWTEDISKARTLDDLPRNARDYVAALEEMIKAPISAIGVGPGRDETIAVRDLLD